MKLVQVEHGNATWKGANPGTEREEEVADQPGPKAIREHPSPNLQPPAARVLPNTDLVRTLLVKPGDTRLKSFDGWGARLSLRVRTGSAKGFSTGSAGL